MPRVRRQVKHSSIDIRYLINLLHMFRGLTVLVGCNASLPSRHILTIDTFKFMFTVSYIYIFQPLLHCWVAIPGYMACPLLGSSYPA